MHDVVSTRNSTRILMFDCIRACFFESRNSDFNQFVFYGSKLGYSASESVT